MGTVCKESQVGSAWMVYEMRGIGEFVGHDNMHWAPVVTRVWKGSG